jgi:hypothetical protein
MEGWVKDEHEIAGLNFKKGDAVEVSVGRQRIVGVFKAFDKVLYAFYILTEDGDEIVIPYKNIKYIKKLKNHRNKKENANVENKE